MIYVHHHLGLGDHIVCNALVRILHNKYGKIKLAVKERNFFSVKQMYRDIKDIEFHVVKTDNDCFVEYFKNPTLRLGFERCRNDWEKSFYDQIDIDYTERYSKFYIDRDFAREKILEDKINLPSNFAFVGRYTSEGRKNINVKTKLPIIELDILSDSIFDWIGVLEKADEIHTVDSSIFQLIKQIPVKAEKNFYNVRIGDHLTDLNDSWKTI